MEIKLRKTQNNTNRMATMQKKKLLLFGDRKKEILCKIELNTSQNQQKNKPVQ
jgi:hypothetical protein